MRALVVGSGGREHALVWKLARSEHVKEVFCAPGNGGIGESATCIPISPEAGVEVARFAEEMRIDLTVVGPELPLSLGLVDLFRKKGLPIFGPVSDAAALETSKVFAKLFMQRHGIPTAPFRVCASPDEAVDCIKTGEFGYPLVLKADGLAAGKGVIIAENRKEARAAVKLLMQDKKFGPAGERIVIEKYVSGAEVSFMVIADGERVLPLVPSCDYKRAFDHDEGPNTGGMGAYAPSATVDKSTHRSILNRIVSPTITGMLEEGRTYRGVLYVGLILTSEGPLVLEYNCRFGDPEAQVVLPLLDADLFELLRMASEGSMRDIGATASAGYAVTVVMASSGYPGPYDKGKVIRGLSDAAALEGVTVFHAGTQKDEQGNMVTAGGRVLNVTAVAEQLPLAIFRAYEAAKLIRFEGARYRGDIAHNAVSQRS